MAIVQFAQCPAVRTITLPTFEESGFRFVDYAGKIARFRHCGFLADERRGLVYRSLVARMAGRDGSSRFVPGYQCSKTEEIVLAVGQATWFEGVQGDDIRGCPAAREAAFAADAFAEQEARRSLTRSSLPTLPGRLHEMRERLAA